MARRVQFAGILAVLAALLASWFAWRAGATRGSPLAAPIASALAHEAAQETELRAPGSEQLPPAAPSSTSIAVDAVEPAAASERRAVPAIAPAFAALRGRVVDSRTGQGLPLIDVIAYGFDAEPVGGVSSDRDGRFHAPIATIEHRLATAQDGLSGKRLDRRLVSLLLDEAQDGELVWPLEVGPTLAVRVEGAPDHVDAWNVRLVERWPERDDDAFDWILAKELEPDGLLVARYPNRRLKRESEGEVWVQVEDYAGTWTGEERIERLFGVHSVEIEVKPIASQLVGSVVDGRGLPVEARLTAIQPGVLGRPQREWPSATADESGAWELTAPPGPARVLVVSDHHPMQHVDLELSAGERRRLDLVLHRPPSAGAIRGVVVAPKNGQRARGYVRLTSLDDESTDLIHVLHPGNWLASDVLERDGRFAFEQLPAGRYRLSLLAIDGRTYAPSSIEVEPPAEVVFETEQSARPSSPLRYGLDLSDARTHQPLRGSLSLVRIADFWTGEVEFGDPVAELGHLDQPVTIVVSRHGYRPALLHLPDALRSASREGQRVSVRMELEPGFGLALVVLDGGRGLERRAVRGLAGARVIAGGRVIGVSDASGLALCAVTEPLEEIEVALEGWTLLALEHFRGHLLTSEGLGYALMVPR